MKTFLLATLAATALLSPAAGAGGLADVTVEIAHHLHLLPADRSCAVTVPDGADAGAALDAAVATGCISSWAYAGEKGIGFGRYVTCIESECESFGFGWSYAEGGTLASHGIDQAQLHDGAVLKFTYESWAGFFLP